MCTTKSPIPCKAQMEGHKTTQVNASGSFSPPPQASQPATVTILVGYLVGQCDLMYTWTSAHNMIPISVPDAPYAT